MTDSESRIQNLEQTAHLIDKRQESFETFMRAYIDGNEKRLERFEVRMDQLEAKIDSKIDNLSNQMHNFIIAGTVGVAAIVVAIALK